MYSFLVPFWIFLSSYYIRLVLQKIALFSKIYVILCLFWYKDARVSFCYLVLYTETFETLKVLFIPVENTLIYLPWPWNTFNGNQTTTSLAALFRRRSWNEHDDRRKETTSETTVRVVPPFGVSERRGGARLVVRVLGASFALACHYER